MLSEHLPQLMLGWSIILVAVASPGPAVALLLGVGAAHGRAPALAIVVGIGASSLCWSTATALGLAALFAQYAELVFIARWVGAGFMAWLAWRAFRIALNPPELTPSAAKYRSLPRFALMGFVMQISNPKAILFWLAVAAVGGVGDAPAAVVVIFVVGCLALSVAGHSLYAVVLSSTPVRAAYAGARRWIEATLGTLFTYFAYRLATERD